MAKTNHFRALAAAAGVLVAVGLLVLMMLVLVEPRPAGATFPGINGKIAYTGFDGNDSEIYTINPGGGGRVKLTNNSRQDFRPDWSPDAKRIAYSGYDGQDFEIYTINSDGTGLVQVTDNDTHDLTPSYHPTGARIAYSSFDGNAQQIFVKDDASGGLRFRVTNRPTGAFDPDWSPDGQRIAFEGTVANDYEIYTSNVDGTGLVQATLNSVDDQDPSYHPTGQRIAFSRRTTGSQNALLDEEIFTNNTIQRQEFQVTLNSDEWRDFRPDYSPNGLKIAYEGFDGNDYEIYTINSDGTGLVQVTKNATGDGDPSWGRRVLTLPTPRKLPPS